MNVLIACEFSGVVREAFRKKGHNAFSCDIIDTKIDSPFHLKGDVFQYLKGDLSWDLLIAFPPCTYLCISGNKWMKPEYKDRFPNRQQQREDGLSFVRHLMCCSVEKICIENPIGIISSRIRKPDQVLQPWMFGHGETKATCLWLKNLPPLRPTNIVSGREARIHKMAPSPTRSMERSITYQGIADAMADQWG